MGDREQHGSDRYRGALQSYLRAIRAYPLLSESGEQRLAARSLRGESVARTRLVKSNLRLVVRIARDYARYGAPIEDLISEGNLGLMEAARRFDPERGARFVTYASWWIRKYVIAALNRQRIQASAPILSEGENEAPGPGTSGRSAPLLRLLRRILSFDELNRIDDRTPVEIRIPSSDTPPDDRVNDRQVAAVLHEVLNALGPRYRRILESHYGLDGHPPKSLQRIADEMDCTREWVRQLEQRAIKRARGILDSRRFKR